MIKSYFIEKKIVNGIISNNDNQLLFTNFAALVNESFINNTTSKTQELTFKNIYLADLLKRMQRKKDKKKVNFKSIDIDHIILFFNSSKERVANNHNNHNNHNHRNYIEEITRLLTKINNKNEALRFNQPQEMIDHISDHFDTERNRHQLLIQKNEENLKKNKKNLESIKNKLISIKNKLNNLNQQRLNTKLIPFPNLSNGDQLKLKYNEMVDIIHNEQELMKQRDYEEKQMVIQKQKISQLEILYNRTKIKRLPSIAKDKECRTIAYDIENGKKYINICPPYMGDGQYSRCYLVVGLKKDTHDKKILMDKISNPLIIKVPKNKNNKTDINNIYHEMQIHEKIIGVHGTSQLSGNHLLVHHDGIDLIPCLPLQFLSDSYTLWQLVNRGVTFNRAHCIYLLTQFVHISNQLLIRNIVHFDISMNNYMVRTSDLFATLIDFGCSKQLRNATDVTALSQAVGTPENAAPETQCSYGSHQSDMFSIGTVVFELYTKEPIMANIKRISQTEYTEKIDKWKNDNMEDELAQIIYTMIRWKTDDRATSYQSIGDKLKLLK